MWCGAFHRMLWVPALGTLSPCVFESVAAGVVSLVVMISLMVQGRCLALMYHLKANGRVRKATPGLNGSYIAAGLFMTATHLLHASVSAAILRAYPFHITYHACLAAAWLTITVLAIKTGRLAVSADFRVATATAAAVYAWSLYTYFRLYYDPYGIPMPYIKASIWTIMLQLAAAVLTTVLDFKRQARMPPLPVLYAQAGYEALPGFAVVDGEAGAGPSSAAAAAKAGGAAAQRRDSTGAAGASEADGRTWISLFADACTYVWPEQTGMQLRALACLLLLIAMRFLNLAVPILYKRVVDTLAAVATRPDTSEVMTTWSLMYPNVILYLAAIFFQGGGGGGMVGFINNLRTFLWIPVSQDAFRRISLRTFEHVMAMDLTFHLRKKTGEVTKVVDRGTSAMQNILSTILFNVLPQIFDVLAAATYLAQALEPSVAIIVFFTVGSYIPLTVIITEWRGKLRREMNQTDQVKSARITDALLNYETVKYFTNEKHESDQYARAIDAYQDAEYRSQGSINMLNVVQSAIMFCGISSGLAVCTAGVARRTLTVGDAVLFLSLMAQLYGPLNFFGTYYRTIQQYMIDMENLLELLNRNAGIADNPTAKELVVTQGEVQYDNVSFLYEPGQQVLRNVSFRVPGGQTVAFVGATGGGKSTITRLIFRFYDVNSGAVRIDGQDVRGVTQDSLRRAVGMVPQDTVLFNDTILHNIRYGNLTASDEEVHEVAKLACIHDTIANRFPKGYETVVGERGLRLSGGEKQRVAFARALLKNPAILVLDEATSALDTITEKQIQSALESLRASRTTMIVAHRLSTIADANIIVVMAQGQVAEAGGHAELIAKGGLYAEMWSKQAQGMQDAPADYGSRPGSVVDLPALAAGLAGGPSPAPVQTAAAGEPVATPSSHHHHH